MMLPLYLTLKQHKGLFVLCAAQDIPHRRMVGIISVTHPHIGVGHGPGYGGEGSLITTALGEFLTTSNNPNCIVQEVMFSGGYDWGIKYDDCWCLYLSINMPIKKGEILTVKSLTTPDIKI